MVVLPTTAVAVAVAGLSALSLCRALAGRRFVRDLRRHAEGEHHHGPHRQGWTPTSASAATRELPLPVPGPADQRRAG